MLFTPGSLAEKHDIVPDGYNLGRDRVRLALMALSRNVPISS